MHQTEIDSAIPVINYSDIPLSLYIHLPWCVHKCPYCDFNSHASTTFNETEYVDALLRDLAEDCQDVYARQIETIFIGGGTPSLFSSHAIGRLLDGIRQQVRLTSNVEITLEANPGSADAEHFAGYRDAGVNRLSLGIQTFSDQKLHLLGRIHNRDEAFDAIAKSKQAGIERVNLDLMYGLPSQTPEEALIDLQTAIACDTEHLSWYQLTLEPNTPFFQQPPEQLPDTDQLADTAQQGIQLLEECQMKQYEVSAYSNAGAECRHNLNYWQFGDYLGIGAGAHGKLTLASGKVRRRRKLRQPKDYLVAANQISSQGLLHKHDLVLEFLMNTLRLNQGFSTSQFELRTGLEYAEIDTKIADLSSQGLLEQHSDTIFPTEMGRRYLNEILLKFA